ncbi:MAG TPA: aryl-sulfate sulfotransferase [Polyangiaceae bacterium]
MRTYFFTLLVAACWGLAAGCKDGEAAGDDAPGTGGTRASAGSSGGAGNDGTTGAPDATGGSVSGGGTSTGGSAGAAGETSDACSFEVDAELSPAIPTVGIVTWSVAMDAIDEAIIEFGLTSTGFTLEAPVDLAAEEHRTLLLGMKGEREYAFRIVAKAGARTCRSDTFTLTTGPIANSLPSIQRQLLLENEVASGFIVSTTGLGGRGDARGPMAFILDAEGDVVWWTPAPSGAGSARMNWEGTEMWISAVNNGGVGGEMRRASMDGLDVEASVAGLEAAHHDFTVLPGGRIVTFMHREGGCSSIVQRDPDGTITDLIANVSALYEPVRDCHPNAIHYHPEDDSFTISDRNPNLFVKFSRTGELEWQFGGANALGPWMPGVWQVNHGHHLLENGNFLFFNNGVGAPASPVLEFALDPSAGTATEVWRYKSDKSSSTLGDVQRLPNGNTLVTYSNAGVIHEVNPDGELVQSLATGSLGYATHRPTLYGPPPR